MRKKISRSFSKIIVIIEKHRKTLIALKGFIVGTPTAILGYSTLKFGKMLPLQNEILNYFQEHPFILFIVIIWPIISSIVLSIITDWFERLIEPSKIKQLHLTALISALDNVVGKKMNRFGEYAKKMQNNNMKKEEIFEKITQPDIQIEHLILNLHNLISLLTNDQSIKIVLAEIKDSIPIEYKCFMPNDIIPPLNLTNGDAKNSFFHYCASERKTVFISDIEKHLNKNKNTKRKANNYVPSRNSDDNIGSIICYPVIHEHLNKVIYVISFKSKVVNLFNEKFKKDHSFFVDEFIKRLTLEYSLFYLKNGAQQ